MPTTNLKQNIKYFVIKKIGSYASISKFSWLIDQIIPIDENTLDKVNAEKIKFITKLLFVVINNIDDQNAGNKTAIIKYINEMQELNKQYKSKILKAPGGWLTIYFEEIIEFIQKNMVDNSIADLILLPDDSRIIYIGQSLIKISRFLSYHGGGLGTSDQTMQHRFDISLEAIRALFFSRITQYGKLKELRLKDLDYAIKRSEYSPKIDDSYSLRDTINNILKFHECILRDCTRVGLPNVIIDIIIDNLLGESFSYIKCEESKVTPESKLVVLIEAENKHNSHSLLFSSISREFQSLQYYVNNKLLFYQQSSPGLFNQADLFTDLQQFISTLEPLVESENSTELTKALQREIITTIGKQSKFTEEYPQWHNYQNYMNKLKEILHLLKDMINNPEYSSLPILRSQ